jgi:tetratricopeptide (TPR) repeat protein
VSDQPVRSARLPGLLAKLGMGIAVAVVATVGLLTILEVGLRLVGFGHPAGFSRLERAADGTEWIRENRWVTAPFFAPELLRQPQAFRLSARKAPGTSRIFVLGSSAAMGDPEPAFSISRTLDLLLRTAYPGLRFEVVNAGITAINSNVGRGIAADCARLEPDLFIVYEGPNEVIGPFGPGTVFTPFLGSPATMRVVIFLRSLRVGQLIARTARATGWGRSRLAAWGGMAMFLQQGVSADDPRLDATRTLFQANLRAMADSGIRAGATVLLCTVLSNQRDFAPFLSRHRTGLAPADLARWQAAFDAGNRALAAGDLVAADLRYSEALALDDHWAELHFRLGWLRIHQHRPDVARTELQQALDWDALRFRPDSRLNDVVRSFAGAGLPGVSVVDLAGTIGASSPEGVPGDELLYEHVHLNLAGTYGVARRLFVEVAGDLARRHLVPLGAVPEPMALPEVRRRLGYTTYEQAMIIRELLDRFSRPPFTLQSDNPARLAAYRQMQSAAARLLARPDSGAALALLYEQATTADPGDWMLQRNSGMALVGLGMPGKGRLLLARALAVIPDDVDALFALAKADQALGEPAGAAQAYAALRALEPDYPGLPPP